MDDFDLYDRITDKIMYLTPNLSLDFAVRLAHKAKDGSRRFFHSEYEKTSNFIGVDKSITITRNVKFYFLINDREDFMNSIILEPQDVVILTKIIDQQLFPLLSGPNRVFAIIDNKLVINGKFKPVLYTQSEYKYLSFVPIVYEYQSGQFKEGVHVCMNDQKCCFDLTIDRLYGFYYILSNTAMYNLAAEMMNYVKTPPYGVNKSELAGLGSGANFDNRQFYSNRQQEYEKPKQSGADFLKNK